MSKDTIKQDESQGGGVPGTETPTAPGHEPGTFSFFLKPIKNLTPHRSINLLQLYENLTSPDYKESTLYLRSITDAKEASQYKVSNFDYCTPSVIVFVRNEKGIVQSSGLICMDFDKLSDQLAVKEQ